MRSTRHLTPSSAMESTPTYSMTAASTMTPSSRGGGRRTMTPEQARLREAHARSQQILGDLVSVHDLQAIVHYQTSGLLRGPRATTKTIEARISRRGGAGIRSRDIPARGVPIKPDGTLVSPLIIARRDLCSYTTNTRSVDPGSIAVMCGSAFASYDTDGDGRVAVTALPELFHQIAQVLDARPPDPQLLRAWLRRSALTTGSSVSLSGFVDAVQYIFGDRLAAAGPPTSTPLSTTIGGFAPTSTQPSPWGSERFDGPRARGGDESLAGSGGAPGTGAGAGAGGGGSPLGASRATSASGPLSSLPPRGGAGPNGASHHHGAGGTGGGGGGGGGGIRNGRPPQPPPGFQQALQGGPPTSLPASAPPSAMPSRASSPFARSRAEASAAAPGGAGPVAGAAGAGHPGAMPTQVEESRGGNDAMSAFGPASTAGGSGFSPTHSRAPPSPTHTYGTRASTAVSSLRFTAPLPNFGAARSITPYVRIAETSEGLRRYSYGTAAEMGLEQMSVTAMANEDTKSAQVLGDFIRRKYHAVRKWDDEAAPQFKEPIHQRLHRTALQKTVLASELQPVLHPSTEVKKHLVKRVSHAKRHRRDMMNGVRASSATVSKHLAFISRQVARSDHKHVKHGEQLGAASRVGIMRALNTREQAKLAARQRMNLERKRHEVYKLKAGLRKQVKAVQREKQQLRQQRAAARTVLTRKSPLSPSPFRNRRRQQLTGDKFPAPNKFHVEPRRKTIRQVRAAAIDIDGPAPDVFLDSPGGWGTGWATTPGHTVPPSRQGALQAGWRSGAAGGATPVSVMAGSPHTDRRGQDINTALQAAKQQQQLQRYGEQQQGAQDGQRGHRARKGGLLGGESRSSTPDHAVDGRVGPNPPPTSEVAGPRPGTSGSAFRSAASGGSAPPTGDGGGGSGGGDGGGGGAARSSGGPGHGGGSPTARLRHAPSPLLRGPSRSGSSRALTPSAPSATPVVHRLQHPAMGGHATVRGSRSPAPGSPVTMGAGSPAASPGFRHRDWERERDYERDAAGTPATTRTFRSGGTADSPGIGTARTWGTAVRDGGSPGATMGSTSSRAGSPVRYRAPPPGLGEPTVSTAGKVAAQQAALAATERGLGSVIGVQRIEPQPLAVSHQPMPTRLTEDERRIERRKLREKGLSGQVFDTSYGLSKHTSKGAHNAVVRTVNMGSSPASGTHALPGDSHGLYVFLDGTGDGEETIRRPLGKVSWQHAVAERERGRQSAPASPHGGSNAAGGGGGGGGGGDAGGSGRASAEAGAGAVVAQPPVVEVPTSIKVRSPTSRSPNPRPREGSGLRHSPGAAASVPPGLAEHSPNPWTPEHASRLPSARP